MKITIITPSFNQAQYIEQTIKSVISQVNVNVEYIIVDNMSDDGTEHILEKYSSYAEIIIEKDNGPASAINKGIKKSSGEIIGWLNSDDYLEKDSLEKVCNHFLNNPDSKWVVGDLSFVSESGKMISLKSGQLTKEDILRNPDLIRQPATFFKRDVFEEIGLLDEGIHLVFDMDLIFRISKIYKPKYINSKLANYRFYDNTLTNRNIRKQILEIKYVYKKNKYSIPISYYFQSYIKLIQSSLLYRKIRKYIKNTG